jgi:hypothetical protein
MTSERASVSAATRRRIDKLFDAGLRDEVAELLAVECGLNLLLIGAGDVERVQIAALKQSGGDLDALIQAIELAQTDWRDLLVAAGFAVDVHAHERWLEDA